MKRAHINTRGQKLRAKEHFNCKMNAVVLFNVAKKQQLAKASENAPFFCVAADA